MSGCSYTKPGAPGDGFALSFTKSSGTYGRGGNSPGDEGNPGGGSGGYNCNYVNVTPGNTYTVVVGNGGKGVNLCSAAGGGR